MSKYLKTKAGSLESAVLEAVSPAQQAAIAIAKKEKGEKPKNEEKMECPQCKGEGCDHCDGKGYHTMDEGSKEEYEKFFKAALKKFGVDSPADFKSDEEKKKFFDYIDKNYKGEGEKSEQVNEKVEYVEYKFKNKNDAMKAKSYFDGIQLMSFDVNDDGVGQGELAVDAGNKDMTKYHKEVMKKFKPKVMTQEKKEEVTEGKGTYVGDTGMVERAAKHIANMWKEASKSSKKEEDEEPAKKGEKTTMTGKPMSGVQVSPIQKEK